MKKAILFLLITFVMMTFSACDKKEPLIENADNVSVFYGVSSYALFSQEEELIKELSDCFNGLSFKETEKEMDILTMFSIYFEEGQNSIMQISVDKNGVFWLDGTTDCYEIDEGTFDYQQIKDIYNGSKLEYE